MRECCPGTRPHEADVQGKAEIVGIATARVEVNSIPNEIDDLPIRPRAVAGLPYRHSVR